MLDDPLIEDDLEYSFNIKPIAQSSTAFGDTEKKSASKTSESESVEKEDFQPSAVPIQPLLVEESQPSLTFNEPIFLLKSIEVLRRGSMVAKFDLIGA